MTYKALLNSYNLVKEENIDGYIWLSSAFICVDFSLPVNSVSPNHQKCKEAKIVSSAFYNFLTDKGEHWHVSDVKFKYQVQESKAIYFIDPNRVDSQSLE